MIILYWFKRIQGEAKSFPSNCSLGRRSKAGFSLVEVCLALGVFAFAILSVVGLLVIALDTSRETQRDSTLTSIIRTMDVDLRTATTSTAQTKYYDTYGKPVPAAQGTYQVSLNPATYTPMNGAPIKLWSATISYPPPVYSQNTVVLFGNTTY